METISITETRTINILDAEAFTKVLKGRISDKLILYFGDKMDTSKHWKERTSHAYSFYSKVMNSCFSEKIFGEWNIATYKIDDCRGHVDGEDFLASERNRLLVDIEKTDNIVLFIVDKFLL